MTEISTNTLQWPQDRAGQGALPDQGVVLRQELLGLKSLSCSFPTLPGIINPIEAKQRKGKGAVGAYGSERATQSLQDFPVVDSEEEAEEVTTGQGCRRGVSCATVAGCPSLGPLVSLRCARFHAGCWLCQAGRAVSLWAVTMCTGSCGVTRGGSARKHLDRVTALHSVASEDIVTLVH
jgi:hypothetical protein